MIQIQKKENSKNEQTFDPSCFDRALAYTNNSFPCRATHLREYIVFRMTPLSPLPWPWLKLKILPYYTTKYTYLPAYRVNVCNTKKCCGFEISFIDHQFEFI